MFCNCNWLRFLATIWPVPPVYPPPPHPFPFTNEKAQKSQTTTKNVKQIELYEYAKIKQQQQLTSQQPPPLPHSLSLSVSCYTSPVSIVCQQNFFWNSNFLTSQKLKTFQTKGCPPTLPLILPSAFPAKKQSIQSRSSPIKWGSTQHIERKRERVREGQHRQLAKNNNNNEWNLA